ncbi:hypothetical protein E1B28_002273 [Marasmius oreades]|uniref:Sulfotransferase n=1 Tax=Marasmius oreades TaxID=181124 RepID=A0A9P7RNT0_9AGAR|nr:uncharacterized protein E1B28_002273 [Marasmius oreades]KAG7086308.1 hypothetical protein E1B28_002273 [Marasmius oreades]
MTVTARQRRIFVFSHARTSSNLFIRLLESHPAFGIQPYPFLYAFLFGPETPSKRAASIKAPFMEKLKEKHSNFTFQSQFEAMERAIGETEAQGKIPVIKEHSYCMMYSDILRNEDRSIKPIVDKFLDLPEAEKEDVATATPSFPIPNPTFLPDRLFATFTPVLNIRHPCRMVPSLRRAVQAMEAVFPDEDTPIDTQFKWQRMVYDCYKAWLSTPEGIEAVGGASIAEHLPIVVDGDKLVNNAEGQMETLFRILNLDPSGVQYTWEAREPEAAQAVFVGTLGRSTGVIKGKDGSHKIPVLEEEVKKWTEEWDEKTAQDMKFWVDKAMEDYDYLLKRSI